MLSSLFFLCFTAPCAPKNVTIIRDCSINTVNVYWNPVIGAVRYISNAFAPDGSKEECANQDTYCFFMNLLCGTEYEISVLAFNGKINSSGSPRIKIRTGERNTCLVDKHNYLKRI